MRPAYGTRCCLAAMRVLLFAVGWATIRVDFCLGSISLGVWQVVWWCMAKFAITLLSRDHFIFCTCFSPPVGQQHKGCSTC